MEQQVCVFQLFQGGLEGLHQLMGQLADKAHCVGDHHVQGVADGQEAGSGVQGIKQAVVGGDSGPGDGIEQRGLAGVGVAHDGHHGDLVFHAALTLSTPDPAHLLQLRLELVDLAVDMAAVRLQLGLAGALGADGPLAAGTGLALQMGPHADQPGQQILILGQLHLQAALTGAGPLGEDVQDQAAAVQHLHAGHLRQHPQLGGRQVVVENHHGGVFLLDHAADLLHLALADKAVRVRLVPALQDGAHSLTPGGIHQGGKLRQALLVGAVIAQHRGPQAHQHRIVALFFLYDRLFHICPRFRFSPDNIVYPTAKVKDPQPKMVRVL